MEKEYISTADTAKLIRKALKRAFPGQKFYVRSDTYSGGASIDIYWLDGPTEKEVENVTWPFERAGFDGMIDLKFYYTAWLMPDGTVHTVSTPGTVGSRGVYPRIKEQPKPHLRVDYLDSTEAEYTDALATTSAYQPPKEQAGEGKKQGATVERDRDWLWVYFPTKPARPVLDGLKALGGRWSRSRRGWYFTNADAVATELHAFIGA